MKNGIICKGFEANDIIADLNELIKYCKVRGIKYTFQIYIKLIDYGIYWDFDRSIHQDTFEK